MKSSTYLIVYPGNLAPQDIHVGGLTLGTYPLVAVHAAGTVGLLRAHGTPLHDLAARGVGQLAGDLDVKLEEALQGDIGWKGLEETENMLILNICWKKSIINNLNPTADL